MKKGETYILAAALIFMGMATLDRVLEVGDPCFNSHTDICVEAKFQTAQAWAMPQMYPAQMFPTDGDPVSDTKELRGGDPFFGYRGATIITKPCQKSYSGIPVKPECEWHPPIKEHDDETN